MPDLHMAVCMKVVPKPEEIRVDPITRQLDRFNVRHEFNPPDMNALETALKLKQKFGGRVSILSMGPPFFEPYLRAGLAMGADHIYLLSDQAFGGADTLATTYTLAQGIKKIGAVDLIFCGEESSDGATGQVPPGLAEWLDFAQLTLISEIDLDPSVRRVKGRRLITGGYEYIETRLPCVVSIKTGCNEPRFMDYRIKPWAFSDGRVTIWNASALDADPDAIGLEGSPTMVTELAAAPSQERKQIYLKGSNQEIVQQLTNLFREILNP
jgi:electron transfer flavoprotein beta subunit